MNAPQNLFTTKVIIQVSYRLSKKCVQEFHKRVTGFLTELVKFSKLYTLKFSPIFTHLPIMRRSCWWTQEYLTHQCCLYYCLSILLSISTSQVATPKSPQYSAAEIFFSVTSSNSLTLAIKIHKWLHSPSETTWLLVGL